MLFWLEIWYALREFADEMAYTTMAL